jgi:F-type H+-transporting ATPase subunit delta
MAHISIARRYVQALFSTALKGGTVERVETDLETIDALLRTEPRLLRVFRAPTISPEQKKGIAQRLFETQVSNLTLRFLFLLIDKRREAVLPVVNREFRRLSYAARGILPVTATVAQRLSPEERTSLIAALGQRTGKTVELSEEVDPGLIGGVVLRLGDTIIDGSVAGQLRRLRQQLLAGTA